jgi:uncharacterized protein
VDITPAVPDGRSMIDSYGPGRFAVRGVKYEGSILVFTDRVVPWSVDDPTGVSLESLAPARAAEPPVEVLLIGTGAKMSPLPSALRAEIRAAGLAMDFMDTGAACRTFNILMTEGRRAAAALIAVR